MLQGDFVVYCCIYLQIVVKLFKAEHDKSVATRHASQLNVEQWRCSQRSSICNWKHQAVDGETASSSSYNKITEILFFLRFPTTFLALSNYNDSSCLFSLLFLITENENSRNFSIQDRMKFCSENKEKFWAWVSVS
jgi:hypothetical protein